MSYCVHCGVELDATASFCPLCHTRVLDPGQPVDTVSPKPFPTRRGEVAPAAKQEVALLITAMLASVAVCCGVLNLFLRADRTWSLYVIGASAMLWLWLVPPLLARGMHLLLRLLLDIAAVALYVYLISVDLNGGDWYLGLGDPSPAGAGAAGLPPVGPHYADDSDRQHWSLCVRNGVFCGPLAAPALESVLVLGGAHHLHRHGDSAHHYSPRPRPPGGGAQKVPSLKDVLDRSTARKLE